MTRRNQHVAAIVPFARKHLASAGTGMVLPDKIRYLPAGGFHECRRLDPRHKRRLLGFNHLRAGQNAHPRTMNARPRQEKNFLAPAACASF